MKWYAIRTVYMWGQKADGANVFEERVVAFNALSDQEAFEKAKIEAKEYSKEREDREYEYYPEQVSYLLDEEELIDGYEVWSEMFEAKQSLNEFYENRYTKYEYHPE
jgi:hypothetical protein